MHLTLAFDIGHASIGWCVLSAQSPAPAAPEILGTGVVTFPADDCLASVRRQLRRTRRHIRSTRQRIERMKRWLSHCGVLTRDDLDRPGHPAPFLLAAAALQGRLTLDAWQLWTVLRWYAHNRGYDGNVRWAGGEENEEDTEKEANADALMLHHGTSTMAETVCRCLDLDPAHHDQKISSFLPYKTLNAAYRRKVVAEEVGRLISLHIGKIPGLTPSAARMMLRAGELGNEARAELAAAGVKIPRRYLGGLLFGQLVPRFDNRIINRCPITWAKTYDEALAGGSNEAEARHAADKLAKVPSAKCREFLQYRVARVIANLRADGAPLAPALRARLWEIAGQEGRLTPAQIKKEIRRSCGQVPTNIDAYFKLHPDSAEALLLDPVLDEVRKAEGARAKLSFAWKLLPQAAKDEAIATWRRGRKVTFASLLEAAGNPPELLAAFEKDFPSANKPKRGKQPFTDFTDYLLRSGTTADFPDGRAPYARPVLKQVVAEVLAGFDPTRPARSEAHPDGEDKPEDGVLYPTLDLASRVRQLQNERPLDQLTNNHLVRHRLLILGRLLDDIIAEFVTSGRQVSRVVVEVARELKEFSGMSAKKIAAELTDRLKDFKSAVTYLEEHAPNLQLSGSLIRKCRIAMDLGWKCPFTGGSYDATDLPKLEREHIIPYANRGSNALHGLVLTWPEVNRMKGKRTARRFISENQGKVVEGLPNLSLFTLAQFDAFVAKLDTKGHKDDRRRKRARQALLAIDDFEEKELGFTEGQLTQSSQLMKLALRALSERFDTAICDPIPGPVTAEIRKAWNLTGTLALACPEVTGADGKVLPKDEIRGITHLHHALDAAVLALAAHYFPLQSRGKDQKGLIWQALLKRNRTDEEKRFLHGLGMFERYQRTRRNKDGREITEMDVSLRDLPPEVKERVARSLAECRVMQHIPADRSGAKAELNTWGVVESHGDGENVRTTLRQRETKIVGGRRIVVSKTCEEREFKLLGQAPRTGSGKLKRIRGALIIGCNYGLALDPTPEVIPFHDVHRRLQMMRERNGGKPVRVLRTGMLIRLSNQGNRSGVWRINSAKASLKLDLARPAVVGQPSKGPAAWREVSIAGLLNKGLEVLPRRYTGYPAATAP